MVSVIPGWTLFLLALTCVGATPYYHGKVLNAIDPKAHRDCGSLLRAGYNISGVYRLSLNGTDVMLPCEFREGNALTVILRRNDGDVSFAQPWGNYEIGFGSLHGDFWAGLATIYHLTNTGGTKSLHVGMQDWSLVSRNAVYTYFKLGERNTRYRLLVAGYSGKLLDDLVYQNNMPFSTYDAPDPYGCAVNMHGGWWYNYCAYSYPTGRHYPYPHYVPSGGFYDGMFYKDWHGYSYSLKFVSWSLSG